MRAPCKRPECGSTIHTDGWGKPTRCPHAGASMAAQQQDRQPTAEENFRELFARTAKLHDTVAALLSPEWGARIGIIPKGHPLHPGTGEQAAPIDWQAIAKQRERELKKVGEARHNAEQAIARVRALHREEYGSCEHCTRADSVPYPCPTILALNGGTP